MDGVIWTDRRLLMTLYQLQRLFNIKLYYRMIAFGGHERTGDKAVEDCFKVRSHHSSVDTEENHEKTSIG